MAALALPLAVRNRRPGDRFQPLGPPGARKLQDSSWTGRCRGTSGIPSRSWSITVTGLYGWWGSRWRRTFASADPSTRRVTLESQAFLGGSGLNSTLKSLLFWMVLDRHLGPDLELLECVSAPRSGDAVLGVPGETCEKGDVPLSPSPAMKSPAPSRRGRRQRQPQVSHLRPDPVQGLANKPVIRRIQDHRQAGDDQSLGDVALFVGADPADDRLLDLLHAADAERWEQGPFVRQEPSAAHDG